MTDNDTPEVGSRETVGRGDRLDVADWLIREADQRVKFFPQRRDGVDALIRSIAADLRAPASPDPVRPADAGEGLSEGEKDALVRAASSPYISIASEVERIIAAREAAWAEKYAAVVGERDEWAVATRLREQLDAAMLRNVKYLTHAESAEAALATALREKAEDRARVEGLPADFAHRATVYEAHPEHDTDRYLDGFSHAMRVAEECARSALAIPMATGDET